MYWNLAIAPGSKFLPPKFGPLWTKVPPYWGSPNASHQFAWDAVLETPVVVVWAGAILVSVVEEEVVLQAVTREEAIIMVHKIQ